VGDTGVYESVAAAGDRIGTGVRTMPANPHKRLAGAYGCALVCAVAYAIVGTSSLAPSGFCDEMRARTRQTAYGFVSLSGAGGNGPAQRRRERAWLVG
jgi:hypothetical protein